MRKSLFYSVLSATFVVTPYFCADGGLNSALAQSQVGVGKAGPIIVQVTAEDCGRLTVHVPDAAATYQSGVDAYGRPVAGAEGDAASRPLRLPDSYAIEITVDLQKRFNLPPNARLYAGEAKLGYVTVAPDGRAFFNGEPIFDEEQAMLAALCQEYGPRPR